MVNLTQLETTENAQDFIDQLTVDDKEGIEDLKHYINQCAKEQKENEHSQDKPVTLYQQKILKSANDKVIKKQHEKEVEQENSMRSGSDIEI